MERKKVIQAFDLVAELLEYDHRSAVEKKLWRLMKILEAEPDIKTAIIMRQNQMSREFESLPLLWTDPE